MEGIPRLKAGSSVGSSAEQVECHDELITQILLRVSTRDVLKMSTVDKRWRRLIFDPSFAHTHYKNSHPEAMFCVIHRPTRRWLTETYQFHSYNSETGNLSIVTFSWEGLDITFLNENFELLTTSNGLMCLFQHSLPVDTPGLWVYNPVTKFLRKLSVPSGEDAGFILVKSICYTQNTLKFVMAGRAIGDYSPYTLVFDFQSNSWYKGQPLLRSIHLSPYMGMPLFFNGVIYFAARVKIIDADELKEIRDVEALIRDDKDRLYMIIGYDVNQDQWSFSIFVPASVGYPYCLIEWEGNLLLCAFNSSYEENNRRIRGSLHKCDVHFVFWILDTEHKMWIRERELDLSQEFHTPWKVSASGGVVWFTCGDNSVTVYHMKNRHWSTRPLDDPDDSLAPRHPQDTYFFAFEPTLLSF